MAVSGNCVYVADGNDGLYLVQNDLLTTLDPRSHLNPVQFQLMQNYPNPFNPSTTIEFTLPIFGWVTLKVYSVLGEEVATLVSEKLHSGRYRYNWNARNIPSGVYFYRLQAGDFTNSRKMLLTR